MSARRDDIAAALADHQVIIVSGETGSGKTTQLPKICMQLGRGVAGMIGHTQPRRLAARSVADRIAHELGQSVGRDPGQVVGYQVRFTDEVGPTTLVKLMTDGILLAEIQSDPMLRRYDTLIIDEAHERSLNIDFILGYVARLLPARPDLKVIITSATIDSDRFARHFGTWEGEVGRGRPVEPAPVIEVSGRTYPVEVRYRPLGPQAPSSFTSEACPPAADGAPQADPGARAGAEGISPFLRERLGSAGDLTIDDVVAGVAAGDTECVTLMVRSATAVGDALAMIVSCFNPGRVILAGPMPQGCAMFLQVARRIVNERALALATKHLEILPARDGADDEMRGTAVLAVNAVFRRAMS